MYSLVSASVLALDLARHPSGAAVADAVDRVLALTPDDVRALAAASAEGQAPRRAEAVAARADLHEACAEAPRMSTLMRGVSATVAEGLPGPADARVLVQALTGTLLGGLGDLLALLRREEPLCLPGLPEAGVQAALDAVAVAWAGRAPDVDLSALALLRAPWAAALSPVPAALPAEAYGEGAPALRALLDQVARADDAFWGRVEQAHWARQGDLRWSTAMHEASRAAFESGRLVPVARAQLAAARAFRLAGVSTGARASSAMMAVTAAVQATCTTGLLAPDCEEVLLHAWRSGADG